MFHLVFRSLVIVPAIISHCSWRSHDQQPSQLHIVFRCYVNWGDVVRIKVKWKYMSDIDVFFTVTWLRIVHLGIVRKSETGFCITLITW